MKRLVLAAAALTLSLATSAQAESQLLLPPAAPTALQVQVHNLATLAVYARNCKRDDPDYQARGRYDNVISLQINMLPRSADLGRVLINRGAQTKRVWCPL